MQHKFRHQVCDYDEFNPMGESIMFKTIFSRPCAIAHDQLSLINHLNLQANQRISVHQIEGAASDWLNENL